MTLIVENVDAADAPYEISKKVYKKIISNYDETQFNENCRPMNTKCSVRHRAIWQTGFPLNYTNILNLL